MAFVDEYAAKIEPEPMSGCLIWVGTRDSDGYGQIDLGSKRLGTRRRLRVHRLVYEEAHGPLAPWMEPDHRCRVRACCNVRHMEAVTHVENVMRWTSPAAVNAQKERCPKGHPYTRVNSRGERVCGLCSAATLHRWRSRVPRVD